MSLSLMPLKIRSSEELLHVKSVDILCTPPDVGVEFLRGDARAQVPSSSLELCLKVRGPSPLAFVLLYTSYQEITSFQ
ncbi:hypothetical protein TNCV_1949941 [Trichonephila clavipes]|nr:hypothetical protein TNCV_1949941 [Trichonephila clavipes]